MPECFLSDSQYTLDCPLDSESSINFFLDSLDFLDVLDTLEVLDFLDKPDQILYSAFPQSCHLI